MNEPESLQQAGRTCVLYKGRKFSFFAGCDYFRLSSHPEIIRAVTAGLKKYGLNVAASRVTTGNHALYGELERALARFFGAPAALLVSNGYASNAVVAQTLRNDFSHVVIDAKAHVSLRDASRLFSCPVLEFKTRDPAGLRRVLSKAGRNIKPILLTDAVFTGESEIAPVREYLKIIGPRGMILLDDAHGTGVIIPTHVTRSPIGQIDVAFDAIGDDPERTVDLLGRIVPMVLSIVGNRTETEMRRRGNPFVIDLRSVVAQLRNIGTHHGVVVFRLIQEAS